jgi:hypothetical protein
MKTLLMPLLLLVATAGQAQTAPAAPATTYPKDAATGLIDYTDVVQVEGTSQAELFKRGKIWLASAFKSTKDVIQAEDKEAGFVVAKGFSTINIKSGSIVVPQKLYYTVKLNYKDGRYKYELTEFYISSQGTTIPVERFVFPADTKHFVKINAQYGPQVEAVAQDIITALKAGMLKNTDF